MKTVQTNVRVAAEDQALIVATAARLRAEPGFRERLAALVEDRAGPAVAARLTKLEEQVAWLLSGAIVVPRPPAPRPPPAPPRRTGIKPPASD
jgi:hypothetical protein